MSDDFQAIRYHGPSGDTTDPAVQAAVAQLAAIRAGYSSPVALYADGGVIGQNPSPIGGTWAWCMVSADGVRTRFAHGWISPAELGAPVVSNNHTELLALVLGLEALPSGWAGTVYSDSWVSLQRVFLAAKLNNVPQWLIDRLQALQRNGTLAETIYQLLLSLIHI